MGFTKMTGWKSNQDDYFFEERQPDGISVQRAEKAIRENRGKDAVRGEADKLLSMMKMISSLLTAKGQAAGGGLLSGRHS